jgi:NAD(P)-dependent dehydrogenase (short-subunit alcohol dehydrogenase family)
MRRYIMRTKDATVLVSGGASGLGLACVRRFLELGARVILFDLPAAITTEIRTDLGPDATIVEGDITDTDAVANAVDVADQRGGLRVLVHTAGIGGPLRLVTEDGEPGDLATFERMIHVNLTGTFNVLRLAAASMAKRSVVDGDRGVCVLTSSLSAYEGKVTQIHYASAKGGVVGMTLAAARDLAERKIRVCTIAPGPFETPITRRFSESVKAQIAAEIPHPKRLGQPSEFALLAAHIVENPMLNGETIRLDGALRMGPDFVRVNA